MDIRREVDSSFLTSYKLDLDEAFRTYLNVINPFIIQFEILKNEFPVELQNEIRAIYGHLARAAIADNAETVQRNIEKIKSHTKRAVLDCYKYSCIIYSDRYTEFMGRYEGVDLSFLNDGRFLTEVHRRYKAASNRLQDAKCAETSNISEDSLFEQYEDAFIQFSELNTILENAEDSASYLKHRATRKDIISVVSLLIGIAGFVLTVFSYFL